MEPGPRVGPYEITERIGAGGRGEVFRAHDARLDRDVAIKLLPGRESGLTRATAPASTVPQPTRAAGG
jgi:hypothetical protein